MATPRDEGAPRGDDTPTEFVPLDSSEPAHRPPAFPSVGGTPPDSARTEVEPPFTRADQELTLAPPQIPVATTGPAFSADRNGRWRWVAAGLATALVLALVAGVFVFFGAQPATPSLVAQYVPADPVAFVELRLDQPGDQRERLATFLSNFPGFADPAAFQQKIDETLAKALSESGTGLEWERDIAPWFGGMIGVYVTSVDPTSSAEPSGAVVLSVKDRAKLDELVAARTANGGVQQQDYKGRTIWTGATVNAGEPFNFTVTDEAFLASPRIEDVQAALDARAGDAQGLADDSHFTTQLSELHADRLGLFYFDNGQIVESMPFPTGIPGGLPGGVPQDCFSDIASAAEVRILGELRAENDHLPFNVRAEVPPVEGLPEFPNKNTGLPASMPANTVAYLEYREIGGAIKYYVGKLLDCLPAQDGGEFSPDRLEQMIGTAPETYFDFLHDLAIGVTLTDGKFGGGLIATVDDENVARTRVERVLSAVRLAAGMSTEITIEERQHAEATITVLNVGGALLPNTPVSSVAITVARGRLYIGVEDFVTTALDQSAENSLANAPRLQSALASAGHENASLVYVDIAALRGFVEGKIPEDERTEYDTEVKPFVEPITQLVLVGVNDSGIYASHIFLYVE